MGATKQKSSAGKNVLIFFIVFLILEMLIVFGISRVFKNKDVTPSIGGYSLYLMDSDKMAPNVPQGSLVIAANNGTPSVEKIGQAVVCEDVADIGTSVFWLYDVTSKGDTVDGVVYTVIQNNDTNKKYEIKSGNIVGIAVNYYTAAGAVIRFICSSFGKIVCAVVPLFFLVLIELIIAIATHSSKVEDDDDEEDEEEQTVTLDDFLFGGENEGEQIAKHLQRKDTMLKKNEEHEQETVSDALEKEKTQEQAAQEVKKETEKADPTYYEKASKLIDEGKTSAEEKPAVKESPKHTAQRRPKPHRSVQSDAKSNASLEDLMKLMEQEQNKLKEQLNNNKKQ